MIAAIMSILVRRAAVWRSESRALKVPGRLKQSHRKISAFRMDATEDFSSGRSSALRYARNFRADTKTNGGASSMQLN